jgi:hypothetical protein
MTTSDVIISMFTSDDHIRGTNQITTSDGIRLQHQKATSDGITSWQEETITVNDSIS